MYGAVAIGSGNALAYMFVGEEKLPPTQIIDLGLER